MLTLSAAAASSSHSLICHANRRKAAEPAAPLSPRSSSVLPRSASSLLRFQHLLLASDAQCRADDSRFLAGMIETQGRAQTFEHVSTQVKGCLQRLAPRTPQTPFDSQGISLHRLSSNEILSHWPSCDLRAFIKHLLHTCTHARRQTSVRTHTHTQVSLKVVLQLNIHLRPSVSNICPYPTQRFLFFFSFFSRLCLV